MRPFAVNVVELLRRPATQKQTRLVGTLPGLRVVDAFVPDDEPIAAEVVLESLADGVVVSGEISTTWESTCRRCLEPVTGPMLVAVRELYQHDPNHDDAFSFRGDVLDLEPMVREAVLLELPLAPLCRPDCLGLCAVCGANRNRVGCGHDGVARDERWAVLDELLEPGRLDHSDN